MRFVCLLIEEGRLNKGKEILEEFSLQDNGRLVLGEWIFNLCSLFSFLGS